MPRELTPADHAKRAAAERSMAYVEPGMRLGLGTGSTAAWMVELLGERVRDGLKVTGVATSLSTARLAHKHKVPLTTLDEAGWLDLTIDGTDEFAPDLTLIKGGGGALLKEKIVANASDRMVVITDPAKRVEALGAFPLPVEIVQFAWETTKAIVEEALEELDVDGHAATLRLYKDEPFITDEGNLILDLYLRRIGDPARLERALNMIPGVIENGLFIGLADVVIVGHDGGETEVIERPKG